MNRCPLTYDLCGNGKYSPAGLRALSGKLTNLADLPFDRDGLRREAMLRADKLSIQGVQPKLSAILNLKESGFSLVNEGGKFILKPQTDYPQLPENEDLTMHLAALSGFDVPLHGLIFAADQSLVYFIQRFDRQGRSKKVHVEDFAQLAGKNRNTKYDFSMERLVTIIDTYCTFPAIEKAELFRRTVFAFLTGNEDMHLKNFSVIVKGGIVRLSPVYDFVNTSVVLRDPEEMALPLAGKKRGLTRRTLIEYFGRERLGLASKIVDEYLTSLEKKLPEWFTWIEKSFLSDATKAKYKEVIERRAMILWSGK